MPRYDDDDDEDDYVSPPSEPEPETCPQCGSRRSKKVSFTMWGGAVGPMLYGLVKCKGCGQQYMRKSGKAFEWSHIIGYSVATGALAVLLLVLLLGLVG